LGFFRQRVYVGTGSFVRIRGGRKSGLQCGAKLTFDPERRQCGGFRPFKPFEANARIVP
jgi:hypothetical protein